jgi:hypothetical protein
MKVPYRHPASAVVALGFAAVLFASPTLADPPSWAPAHGWREKHRGHDDDDRAVTPPPPPPSVVVVPSPAPQAPAVIYAPPAPVIEAPPPPAIQIEVPIHIR